MAGTYSIVLGYQFDPVETNGKKITNPFLGLTAPQKQVVDQRLQHQLGCAFPYAVRCKWLTIPFKTAPADADTYLDHTEALALVAGRLATDLPQSKLQPAGDIDEHFCRYTIIIEGHRKSYSFALVEEALKPALLMAPHPGGERMPPIPARIYATISWEDLHDDAESGDPVGWQLRNLERQLRDLRGRGADAFHLAGSPHGPAP